MILCIGEKLLILILSSKPKLNKKSQHPTAFSKFFLSYILEKEPNTNEHFASNSTLKQRVNKTMPTTIAIIQTRPAIRNLQACLEKATTYIKEAAQQGAQMIVFGECWFTGYPAWIDYCLDLGLWDHPPVKKLWATLYEQALEIPSPPFQQLQNLARQYRVFLILGANEAVRKGKGSGTLYNAALIIGPDGQLLNHHRKLMPTYTERLIHGLGDGHGLRTVDTPHGRLGTLICWEHWMPLARQVLHDEAEEIHFALWPFVKDSHLIASRQYAYEGRCYVVAVGQIYTIADLPQGLQYPPELSTNPTEQLLRGGSCAIGPDGNFLLEPQYGTEGIIYLTLPPLADLYPEKMNLAVSGHYQRPDVFQYTVNRQRNSG